MSEAAGDATQNFRWPTFFRSLVGFVLAPMIGGGLAFVGSTLSPGNPIDGLRLSVFAIGAFGGLVLGMPISIFIAWPLHLFLLERHWTRLAFYIAPGALLAMLPYIPFATYVSQSSSSAMLAWSAVCFAIAGAIGALLFWLIRRPDRDTPPTLDVASEPPDLSPP
jgi:hypothetical protein